MATIKISELTQASSATAGQEFEVNDGGSAKKLTGSQIKAFVKDGLNTSDLADLTVSAEELNFLDGVVSNIQTQLDSKATNLDPSFSGAISVSNLIATSATELTLDGTDHAIQAGVSSDTNVAISDTSIQARDNSLASSLSINPLGGDVTVGNSDTTTNINGSVAGSAVATKALAELGTSDDTLMTPLRTKQAMDYGVRSYHKTIITGDWQPRIEYPEEILTLKNVMDDMQEYHGDADDMIHVGDIVERASEGQTGDTSAVYSHEDVLNELYARVDIPRIYFITGNHDSDGFGAGAHEHAWTHRQFLDYIGRRFYYTRQGNLVRIFMGPMSGAAGGEVNRLTLYWFDQVVKRSKGCNIEVYLHQPLYGYKTFVENSQYVQYKETSDSIVQTLSEADNIAFVASGHVARPEDLPNHYDLYGTTLVGFNMHIPRVSFDAEWEAPGTELPYGVVEYTKGSTSATIKFWDAATHTWLAGRDVAVSYKYPMHLGGGVPDFDGRYASSSTQAMFDNPVTIQRDLSEDRENLGTVEAPNWSSVAGMRSFLRLALMENSVDNAKEGDGAAIDWWLPGSTFSDDASGKTILNISSTTLGGRVGVVRENGNDTDYTGRLQVQLGTGPGTTGALRDVLTVDGSTGKGYMPLANLDKVGMPDLLQILVAGMDNSLIDKGEITTGDDLDTFAEPGVYRILSGTVAAGVANVPYTSSGASLLVLDSSSLPSARPVAAAGQVQIYIARAVTDGPRIYVRVCSSSVWRSWRLLAHDGLSLTSIASAPEFRGQYAYVSGSPNKIYQAFGTSSPSDWIQIG